MTATLVEASRSSKSAASSCFTGRPAGAVADDRVDLVHFARKIRAAQTARSAPFRPTDIHFLEKRKRSVRGRRMQRTPKFRRAAYLPRSPRDPRTSPSRARRGTTARWASRPRRADAALASSETSSDGSEEAGLRRSRGASGAQRRLRSARRSRAPRACLRIFVLRRIRFGRIRRAKDRMSVSSAKPVSCRHRRPRGSHCRA